MQEPYVSIPQSELLNLLLKSSKVEKLTVQLEHANNQLENALEYISELHRQNDNKSKIIADLEVNYKTLETNYNEVISYKAN
ncbi:hypothetical protein [Staphylococcus hominis]|jgi:hypothetical protein|uniref:hypothetical protein n=1 Tax=Staphylococcus hominis TaxID=1290 RepID=UPI002878AE85|nr:hypothetical protein [Staphylococcus hominis]MDS3889761.1 hypothetical protein [Staphylococcus hominis]